MTPGTANPSDVEQAIELGLEVVKFFPAEAAGGLNMIKSMAAPYTNMKFMPTGGINAKNINSYLAFPKILACGGSWMVKGDLVEAGEFDKITELTREAVMTMLGFELKHIGINCENVACGGSWMVKGDLVEAGEFDKITELTREAVMTMLGFELKHIGINCENEEEAEKTAGTFASLFGFEKKSGNSSVFAGSAVEAMKSPYLGAKGHIAVGTNSVDRAVNYLESQGVEFNMDSSVFAGSAVEAMKSPYLGAKGHIAVGTNSVDRAVNYLESQGVEFNMDSAKYKDGKLTAIYLKEEVAGFAVHLVQK